MHQEIIHGYDTIKKLAKDELLLIIKEVVLIKLNKKELSDIILRYYYQKENISTE